MRRLIPILLVAAGLSACLTTLAAQTLPLQVTASWDPNPATDAVTGYVLTLDAEPPIAVAPVTDPACTCVHAPLTIGTAGAHTIRVVAQNEWGDAAPTVYPFLVTIPSSVKNIKVKK